MNKVMTMAATIALLGAAVPGHAYEAGDVVLRLGATMVAPEAKSGDINLPTGLVAEADVDDDIQLGIIPVYMVDSHWGVELLAATPFEHDIEAKGKGAIAGTTLDAGSTKHLPPTLSVQYYPRGGESGWQPYIGVGVNYTLFFDEDVDSELIDLLGDLTGGAVTDANLDLENSFGLSAQAGVDIPVTENLGINLAVWYIDIDTRAEITAMASGMEAAKVKFDVDIDPWVFNLGIAYRF